MAEELDRCYRLFAALEYERGETLAELAEWTPRDTAFRPAPGAWCAVEVLDHVVRAEEGTIADLQLGLRNPHPLSAEERPGVAGLDHALRSEQRFQVPGGAESILPDTHATLPEVATRWERARDALRQLVDGLAPEDTVSGVFEHPGAGWMTCAEVLEHLDAHLQHHRFQLARLRAGCQCAG